MAKAIYVWDGEGFVSANVPVGAAPNAVAAYNSASPTNAQVGTAWFDTNTNKLKVYSGSAWIEVSVDLSDYAELAGATFTGTISGQHINPSSTNTYDLGTSSLRWRNIYTQDLHLSNGIGDYTIVEGEEDLYLTNNKTKKSYKFALIEVDSSEVPPKSEE